MFYYIYTPSFKKFHTKAVESKVKRMLVYLAQLKTL